MDSGRAVSFVTLGTRNLPTLRSFYRSWAGPSATDTNHGFWRSGRRELRKVPLSMTIYLDQAAGVVTQAFMAVGYTSLGSFSTGFTKVAGERVRS